MRLLEAKLQLKPGFFNGMSSKCEKPLSLLAKRELTEHPNDDRAASRLRELLSHLLTLGEAHISIQLCLEKTQVSAFVSIPG